MCWKMVTERRVSAKRLTRVVALTDQETGVACQTAMMSTGAAGVPESDGGDVAGGDHDQEDIDTKSGDVDLLVVGKRHYTGDGESDLFEEGQSAEYATTLVG